MPQHLFPPPQQTQLRTLGKVLLVYGVIMSSYNMTVTATRAGHDRVQVHIAMHPPIVAPAK